MLDEARKKLMKYDDRVKFEHINIDDYKSNFKFDIILNIYLLPFYENENKLINLVSNHLKKMEYQFQLQKIIIMLYH